MGDVLRVEKLSTGYGKLQVLFDVTTGFKEKAVTAIVGPNGSGKSTFLKSVFGLTKIFSGRVLFDGRDITGSPPHKVARMGIAYLPQLDNSFVNLTVRENLMMAGYMLPKEEVADRISEVVGLFPVLKDFWSRRAGILSGGQRQMLAMAMALMRRPRLMLYDEPTGNLAPTIALEVLSKICEVRDKFGVTTLLVEQNARRALENADDAVLLVSGQVVFDGGAKELLGHKDLSRLYLGVR